MLIVSSLSNAQEMTPWPNTNIAGSSEKYSPKITDDFYGNVNHEWLSTAQLKLGYPRVGAFTELQDIIDVRLKGLMTDGSIPGHDAELVRRLYSLWLDWDARNNEGLADLKEQAAKITAIETIDELSEYLMSEECMYNGTMILDFGIGRDNKDSESFNLELVAPGLSLGDSAEYKTMTPNGERTRKMHEGVVSYMLRRLGYTEDFARDMLAREYSFEARIAPHIMTLEEGNSPEAITKCYNPITMDELREKSPVYPFAEILEAHEALSDLINLQEPASLKALNELYTPENLDDIKAYMLCRLVAGYITLTDEPAYREYQRLRRERYGISGDKPDDEIAVDFVHGQLSVPLSKVYVSRYVPESTKNEIAEIIRQTVKYYRAMLDGEEWLSEATRRKAIEKLDAVRLNSAYPEKWVDFSEFEFPEDAGLFEAMKALEKYKYKRYFYDRLNEKVDHDIWIDDVVTVNAYYMPSENSINIIAGILGGDFYSPEMSYEEKLGGIGFVIGHELSHAFDTSGAQFDRTGNVSSWWTDEDYASFKARADRLIKYLDTFNVDGSDVHYNGSLIQTETIADMAGGKAMLGIAGEVEGFDYDKFFRSYARIWKMIMTREMSDMRVKSDVHALPYIRVNAIVQQYGKFYTTYGVKRGDKMYLAPEDRVAVW